VEDRLTTGLYLEMTDTPVDTYVEQRVPELLDHPGVTRAAWWRNVRRDRDDLPRVLPEFEHLGVYEVDDDFAAPTAPKGIAGHYFTRTTRPGQGIITGRPTIGLSLVLISPKDEARAQELRDWADFVHIRHIAEVAVPGYCMITPYENVTRGDPRYLHFYEMDTDDPEQAFQAMAPRVAKRLGGVDTEAFKEWAWESSLRIMYVNSFVRLGVAAAT
jgi:hypothetical protein